VGATIAGGRGNYASGESSVIAGGELNTNTSLSSIGGGIGNSILSGSYNVIAGGVQNSIQGFQSIIGGGVQNSIQGSQSIIGGGGSNTNVADSATIGGGDFNNIQSGAQYAFIGGGVHCTIQTNAFNATIGGGSYNLIQSGAQFSTIAGGANCQILESAQASTVAGGQANFVQPNAQYASIGGGFGNSSAGIAGTVPGGELNQATGRDSFAAGQRARAYHDGSFVWADYSNPSNLFASIGPNQFLIRAAAGVGIGTNNPQSALHVAGTVTADSGNFPAGNITVGGRVNLPVTTATAGIIYSGGNTLLHAFGPNVFVGLSAGNLTLSGSGNACCGNSDLANDTTGNNNSVLGHFSMGSNTSGNNNTAAGYEALLNNTTGNNNIGLGYQAGFNLTTGSSNICIAHPGVAGNNNTIRIGTAQTNTFIAGIFGATTSAGTTVFVNSAGQLGTVTSSARFKQNIQDMDNASDVLLALRPVTFRYKPELDPNGTPQFGLVAEEVDRVDPDLVVRDSEQGIYSVRYEAVNAMLLNEFLKQHHKVQELENKLSELQTALKALQEKE
jgi:hypothetical protein